MSERIAMAVQRQASGTAPVLRRKCACGGSGGSGGACAECKKKKLQRRAVGSGPEVAPPIVHEVLRSPGQPLDSQSRTFFDPRFGHDFSKVRVHADDSAAQSADAVNALAYTVGPNVVFASGQYSPDSRRGKELLAHELVHTLQQGHSAVEDSVAGALVVGDSAASPEREAESAARMLLTGAPVAVSSESSGSLSLRRQAAPTTGLLTSFPSLPSLPPLPTSLPAPCHPATSRIQALGLHAFVSSSWLRFAKSVFGPETASLWGSYLDTTAGIPRAARTFSGKGEIVDGFTKHHKSAEAEREVVNASAAVLAAPAGASLLPAAGKSATVAVTSVVPATTLTVRVNNAKDPMGLDYDNPATTIPGNIAGGIGAGGPPGNTAVDPDTRDVGGALHLDLDTAGTGLTITPLLTFKVHDTVDFCPGALGGAFARVETVPMSILEATEGRFGTVFAADVPFDVSYPGPAAATKTISVPLPAPVVPAPVVPKSSPTTYTVVKGDYLIKIAEKFYGDGSKYKKIYKANVGVIGPDPDKIYVGQVLTIPP